MCDDHVDSRRPTRRQLLIGGAIGGAIGSAAMLTGGGMAGAAAGRRVPSARPQPAAIVPTHQAVAPVPVRPGLAVYPRAAWGADLPPKRASARETPKFLLVHHTASSYLAHSTRDTIRTAYWWQTSPAKRWSDVCYGFFVGRNGDVWEGRNGALAHPVVGDATGGNQGWAQLVCLVGDFTRQVPTTKQVDALVKILAHLTIRDRLPSRHTATTRIVSRGSNRWARGTIVTTPVINGHRSMTATECPGDNLWKLLPTLRLRVEHLVAEWS